MAVAAAVAAGAAGAEAPPKTPTTPRAATPAQPAPSGASGKAASKSNDAPKATEPPKPAAAPKTAEAPKPAAAPKAAEPPKPAAAPKAAEPPKPADPAAPAASSAQLAPVAPAGTDVWIVLKQELDSGRDKVGEPVKFEVLSDVFAADGHTLLIPAGSPAIGKVEYASTGGMLGRSGKLRFSCDYVQLKDGVRIPLKAAERLGKAGDDKKLMSLVMALAPGHLGFLEKGQNANIHEGVKFHMKVAADTVLSKAATAATAQQPPAGASSSAASPSTRSRGPDAAAVVSAASKVAQAANSLHSGTAAAPTPAAQQPAAPTASATGAAGAGKDLLLLKGGLVLTGTLGGLERGQYTIVSDSGAEKVKAADVLGIYKTVPKDPARYLYVLKHGETIIGVPASDVRGVTLVDLANGKKRKFKDADLKAKYGLAADLKN